MLLQKYLDELKKHNVDAPILKEFLERGCIKPAMDSLAMKINVMETQLEILRSMQWELELERNGDWNWGEN